MGTMVIKTQAPFGVEYPMSLEDYGPYGSHFECADGDWIFLSLGKVPGTMDKFLEKMGCPDLYKDPRFDTPEHRAANKVEYLECFRKGMRSHTAEYWLEFAKEYDMPMVRMAHFADVSEDPQAWANGFLEKVEFKNGNVDVMPASPIEMESACPPPTKPAPFIGADTEEVLRSIGYTDEEAKALLDSGAAIVKNQ